MTLWRMVTKEILHRKLNFALGVLSAAVGVGCLVGALALLRVHDAQTRWLLERREEELKARMAVLNDDMRKAMLTLGFNIVILPRDQNLADWYADDYASKYMPESYVDRLAEAETITIRHLLPSLQQKTKWPEVKRTIILIGTRGEVESPGTSPMKPLVQPVADGTIVLGYELHQSLALKEGDAVRLLDKEFTVARCHPERGTKDDITVWMSLGEAQELLDKPGQINAILALECMCAGAQIGKVREEITRILPNTQIIERGSKALARAEARSKVAEEARTSLEEEEKNRAALRSQREQLASILVPVVLVASGVSIGLLALVNVRERRGEIAILRALGLRSWQIVHLVLTKAVAVGLLGGIVGVLAGHAAGRQLGIGIEQTVSEAEPAAPFQLSLAVAALLLAPALAALASWIPAALAARQDPADILREE
jgi:putative ABC transport system permease protein